MTKVLLKKIILRFGPQDPYEVIMAWHLCLKCPENKMDLTLSMETLVIKGSREIQSEFKRNLAKLYQEIQEKCIKIVQTALLCIQLAPRDKIKRMLDPFPKPERRVTLAPSI